MEGVKWGILAREIGCGGEAKVVMKTRSYWLFAVGFWLMQTCFVDLAVEIYTVAIAANSFERTHKPRAKS